MLDSELAVRTDCGENSVFNAANISAGGSPRALDDLGVGGKWPCMSRRGEESSTVTEDGAHLRHFPSREQGLK